mmetsp:Transcript_97350/g.231619  ORF Transcript_97350/g.231619 Transcript_97350/m.231619 type:complete len:293 (+) Transcript_97350:352-1230(+)
MPFIRMITWHVVDGDVQGRFQPKAGEVDSHARENSACLPANAVQELGHAPNAEGVHLVRGEVLNTALQLLHVGLQPIAPAEANLGEVSGDLRLLTRLRGDKLVEGPQGHHESGRLRLAIHLSWILAVRVVEVANHPLNCPDEHGFHLPRSSRCSLTVCELNAEVKLAGGHLLQAHLHPDLPKPLPSTQMPAVGVVPRGLSPGLVSWPMHCHALDLAELILILCGLQRVGSLHTVGRKKRPPQWILVARVDFGCALTGHLGLRGRTSLEPQRHNQLLCQCQGQHQGGPMPATP